MATVCPPAQGCKQIDVNGRRYTAGKDGLFHGVRDRDVKSMVKGGECFTPRTGFRSAAGWVCPACGWEAVINHCPRCDREDLIRQEG